MLRYALSPRWIPGHLLALALMALCLKLSAWQWDVATQPLEPGGAPHLDWQNAAYTAQWAFFAGVVAWFWWRYLRDEREADLAWDAEQARLDAEEDAAHAARQGTGEDAGRAVGEVTTHERDHDGAGGAEGGGDRGPG